MYVAAFQIFRHARLNNWGPFKRHGASLIPLALLVPGYMISYVEWPISLVGPFAILWLADMAEASKASDHMSDRAISTRVSMVLASVMVTLLAAPLAVSRDMWLPPERVEHAGKIGTVYVLGSSGDDLVVFKQRERSVQRLPAKEVKREYCSPKNRLPTLAEGIFGKPKGLPVCP